MQLFEINSQQRRMNRLKNWALDLAFYCLLYLILSVFWNNHPDFWFGLIAYLIIRLGRELTQQHVSKIEVDKVNDILTIYLKSTMSGDDEKSYPLSELSSIVNTNSKWTTWLHGPITLQIFIPHKKMFSINGVYGFSPVTLMNVDAHLK